VRLLPPFSGPQGGQACLGLGMVLRMATGAHCATPRASRGQHTARGAT